MLASLIDTAALKTCWGVCRVFRSLVWPTAAINHQWTEQERVLLHPVSQGLLVLRELLVSLVMLKYLSYMHKLVAQVVFLVLSSELCCLIFVIYLSPPCFPSAVFPHHLPFHLLVFLPSSWGTSYILWWCMIWRFNRIIIYCDSFMIKWNQ